MAGVSGSWVAAGADVVSGSATVSIEGSVVAVASGSCVAGADVVSGSGTDSIVSIDASDGGTEFVETGFGTTFAVWRFSAGQRVVVLVT